MTREQLSRAYQICDEKKQIDQQIAGAAGMDTGWFNGYAETEFQAYKDAVVLALGARKAELEAEFDAL